MIFEKTVTLKDGRALLMRNGDSGDGAAVFDVFNRTHEETDNMLTYPDENTYDPEKESEFLQKLTDSENQIEILAIIDGVLAGTAGVVSVGTKDKQKHRAEFGIGILREYWGLGVGRALTEACVECARKAGYTQIELDVVSDNSRAISLYEKCGFAEYGRNPRGFRKRNGEYQELIYMRMEL
ncbi:MAG: GNAT family N-acetyltransferase [Clostridia bacterium]|nr:GNAT family N-acetyltransferase [Clostridia bacterium]